MFGFFRKKKVDRQNIKAFDGALKAINVFIVLSEWSKAKKAIEEIEYKEKKSLTIKLERLEKEKITDWGLENELERKNLTEDLKLKIKKLEKLTLLLNKKEEIYNERIKKERFKIRFHKMRIEIDLLIWNNSNDHALWLLQKFLEENPNSTHVIKFYNKEKKKILKNVERIRKKEEMSGKKNATEEAMSLIWEVWNIGPKKDKKKEETEWFFERFKNMLNFYKSIKERLRRKQLLDEINLLIEEDSKINNDVAEKKLANLHKWLVKEVSEDEMEWYDIYWKILSNNRIVGDTFGYVENKSKFNFFIWDATWHWIRAWFIITLLSRIFNKHVKDKDLQNLTYTVNNWLKQDLKLSNFITWIFFEIEKFEIWRVNYVWMWHEPMLLFRKKENIIERIIPWGLAAWIRLIKNLTEIKVKHIDLDNGDIILTYSASIIESKNSEGESYWLERLKTAFIQISQTEDSITKIYDYIIRNIKEFMWEWETFIDDASLLMVKRNIQKDIMDDSEYLKELKAKEWLTNSDIKKLKWKTLDYIDKELVKIKKRKETKRIVKILENLYYTWEVLKLKQESIRYIKEWFIDKKINKYLKLAINKEKAYKIDQKQQKMASKFHVLEQLLKKWDFKTVISEIEEVIWNDWEFKQ